MATRSYVPPTLELITNAISAERDPRGTSVVAIKRHIHAHHQVRSDKLLNHMLRRAFRAALAAGKLTRPRGQADTSLLSGRYRLAPVKANKPKTVLPKPKALKKTPARKGSPSPKQTGRKCDFCGNFHLPPIVYV